MKLTTKTALCAALSAAFSFGAADPVHAQATPIAAGGGAFVASQNQEKHLFSFHVVELPNGAVTGRATVHEPASNGFVNMEISSYMFIGDILAVAGRITKVVNAPPEYIVGATAFFAVIDNGPASPDVFAGGLGVVPPMFGNLTIQQIVAFVGPPPPEEYAPLLSGNINIF